MIADNGYGSGQVKHSTPVIIFGDFIAAYGAIRGLSRYGIPIHVVSPTGSGLATKSRYARRVLQLDPGDADFVGKLRDWFSRDIGGEAVAMVAGDDDYLDVLAKRHSELPCEMKTTFPDWETVRLVREKRQTYTLAQELGIPIPATCYITCQADLASALGRPAQFSYPLLMKSEDSAAFLKRWGTKGVICDNEDELLQNYLQYDGFYGKLLLQEMIPGGEDALYCLKTVLNRRSEPLAVFVDRKVRSSRQFSSCTLTRTAWSDEVVGYGLALLRRIGYSGYASVEFKFDHRDGQFKMMEINGRISMNNSHALRCGVNLPYLMYAEALDKPLPALQTIRQEYPNNTLWWYFTGDIVSVIYNRAFLRPVDCIRSLIGRGYIIEPMNWRDPYPGILSLIRLCGMVYRGLRKLVTTGRSRKKR